MKCGTETFATALPKDWIDIYTKPKFDQAGSFEPAQWAPKPPTQSIGRDLLIEDLYVLAFMMDVRKFPKLGTQNPDRSIPPNHLRWPQVGDHDLEVSANVWAKGLVIQLGFKPFPH